MTSTPKSLLVLCCLAVGFLTAASVQAVPTTYQYTGNPFAAAASPYTTSDFVSGMLTLAGPLAPNMPLNVVTPLAFSFSDGVQTLTSNQPLGLYVFEFATGPTGSITEWLVHLYNFNFTGDIATVSMPHNVLDFADSQIGSGVNLFTPGVWATVAGVPDTGSSLPLMTLTLMALGVAARRFKQAAA